MKEERFEKVVKWRGQYLYNQVFWLLIIINAIIPYLNYSRNITLLAQVFADLFVLLIGYLGFYKEVFWRKIK